MNKTLIIESLAIFSIAYELIKIIFVKKYWTFGLRKNKNEWSLFLVADSVYLGLVIGLIFTHYFIYGLTILAFSGLTAYLLRKEYFSKEAIDGRIKTIICSDSVVSIIILAYLLYMI